MNILVSGAATLDVIFFIAVLLGILLGVWRGFVKGVCKLAGTIFAIAFAVFFCMPMSGSLESTFGLTTALTDAIGNAKIAGWISVAIGFVAIVVIIKLGAWFLGKVGTKLVNKSKTLGTVNRALGGVLGLVKALLWIFIPLAICRLINLGVINDFISASTVVGSIYNWKWFVWATRLPGIFS